MREKKSKNKKIGELKMSSPTDCLFFFHFFFGNIEAVSALFISSIKIGIYRTPNALLVLRINLLQSITIVLMYLFCVCYFDLKLSK